MFQVIIFELCLEFTLKLQSYTKNVFYFKSVQKGLKSTLQSHQH